MRNERAPASPLPARTSEPAGSRSPPVSLPPGQFRDRRAHRGKRTTLQVHGGRPAHRGRGAAPLPTSHIPSAPRLLDVHTSGRKGTRERKPRASTNQRPRRTGATARASRRSPMKSFGSIIHSSTGGTLCHLLTYRLLKT
ncbi:uncharacterized protein C9orf40 homolog isoform X2 [Mesocricetus auratus]|uniref:Uncharacterized protein C9orf40 homolog isoform X2 n=1 Tax=Mesocricetus auratus TaxID=10036 RepID=A0ABM2XIC2_MESAU|nr:uncharacterized protein C9orf40 homolog isoform X2 [Mesocricetus auratus]